MAITVIIELLGLLLDWTFFQKDFVSTWFKHWQRANCLSLSFLHFSNALAHRTRSDTSLIIPLSTPLLSILMIISLLSLYLHVFFRAHPPPSLSSHFGSFFFLVIISCHNSPSIHPSVCPPPPCSLVPHPSLTFPLRSNERNVCVSLLQICQKSPLTQSNIHRARTDGMLRIPSWGFWG